MIPQSKRAWARILRGAANLIEEKGWIKNDYGNAYKGYCVLGALDQVTGEEFSRLNKVLGIKHNPAVWNDRKKRTKEDVLKLFRSRARDLEHGGELDLRGVS